MQTLWPQRPIRSAEFHKVFLREQGSMESPLPPRYYVPGDRTWFLNPDDASAEASGFEGSWVMYLGVCLRHSLPSGTCIFNLGFPGYRDNAGG
ncbi:MAG: hypothetical protein AUK50_12085 [Comamonadaceae bacterium CG2_30_57_122]|nr:MAG: hypothetical protein AUK50_12085 [Comamonadaceae bacterium CG2_30_57_122]